MFDNENKGVFEWTEKLAIMYSEVHRFSSGRITISDFKEMIKTHDPFLIPYSDYAEKVIKEANK